MKIPGALVRNGLCDKWDSNSLELSIRLETDNVSARLTRRQIPATGRENIPFPPASVVPELHWLMFSSEALYKI